MLNCSELWTSKTVLGPEWLWDLPEILSRAWKKWSLFTREWWATLKLLSRSLSAETYFLKDNGSQRHFECLLKNSAWYFTASFYVYVSMYVHTYHTYVITDSYSWKRIYRCSSPTYSFHKSETLSFIKISFSSNVLWFYNMDSHSSEMLK